MSGAATRTEAAVKRIQDLELMVRLAQAGGGGSGGDPLSRFKWVDGGSVQSTQDGAILYPWKSISNFLAGLPASGSAADSQQLYVGKVTPALGSYVENVTIPAYRCIQLTADYGLTGVTGSIVTGTCTWTNTALAAGKTPAPTAASIFVVHDVPFSGALTITDDGSSAGILVVASSQENFTPIFPSITATGASALTAVVLNGAGINGAANFGTGHSIVFASNAEVNGLLTCKAVSAVGCSLESVTIAAGQTAGFSGCGFTGTPIMTGGAGSVARFDGPSWNSFLEAGGTLATCVAVVTGGSQQGLVVNATSLGDANVSVSINGTGATAGFTTGGNFYQETTALTAGRTITLLTGGGELTGDTIDIIRSGAGISLNTLTIANNVPTNLAVMPASLRSWARFQFNTVVANNWGFVGGGSDLT